MADEPTKELEKDSAKAPTPELSKPALPDTLPTETTPVLTKVSKKDALAPFEEPAANPDRPPCPVCGTAAYIERRTPDHATHYTVVCNACGYRDKREG